MSCARSSRRQHLGSPSPANRRAHLVVVFVFVCGHARRMPCARSLAAFPPAQAIATEFALMYKNSGKAKKRRVSCTRLAARTQAPRGRLRMRRAISTSARGAPSSTDKNDAPWQNTSHIASHTHCMMCLSKHPRFSVDPWADGAAQRIDSMVALGFASRRRASAAKQKARKEAPRLCVSSMHVLRSVYACSAFCIERARSCVQAGLPDGAMFDYEMKFKSKEVEDKNFSGKRWEGKAEVDEGDDDEEVEAGTSSIRELL